MSDQQIQRIYRVLVLATGVAIGLWAVTQSPDFGAPVAALQLIALTASARLLADQWPDEPLVVAVQSAVLLAATQLTTIAAATLIAIASLLLAWLINHLRIGAISDTPSQRVFALSRDLTALLVAGWSLRLLTPPAAPGWQLALGLGSAALLYHALADAISAGDAYIAQHAVPRRLRTQLLPRLLSAASAAVVARLLTTASLQIGWVAGALVWLPLLLLLILTHRQQQHAARQQASARQHSATLTAQLAARDHAQALQAHDVRAALSAIRASLQLLHEADARLNSAQRARMLAVIDRSERAIAALLDSAAAPTRAAEAPPHTPEPAYIDAAALTRDAIALIAALATAKQITITSTVARAPLHLWADRMMVQQILTNLLSNAVKYTPPHGQISVGVRVVGDAMLFEVTDNGIGISQQDQARIFEPYFRAETWRSAVGGSGLGLAIVRRFVDLHGGWIEIASAPGQGSQFRIYLPLHPDAPPLAPAVTTIAGREISAQAAPPNPVA